MAGFAHIETRWSPGDSPDAQNQPMNRSSDRAAGRAKGSLTFDIVPQ